jgi:hypothetical protein
LYRRKTCSPAVGVGHFVPGNKMNCR